MILAIETSCDETSVAIVKNRVEVLSNVISSQADLHEQYGGVVPEIASRKHVELVLPAIEQALTQASVTLDDVDAVAVTHGPGLVGALLVGLAAAKALAFAKSKPLIGVHHIAAHISANYIENPDLKPPFLCLVVSGGHSHIIKAVDYDRFEIVAQTRDDAAGEAFDKVARVLGLGYPGGPKIDKTAKLGNPNAIKFPRVHFDGDSLDFSFSGVKTAVINYINNEKQKGNEINVPDVAASFQNAVVSILVQNLITAAKRHGIKDVALAGGVAANSELRERLAKEADSNNIKCCFPKPLLCTDNAAMVAAAAYYDLMRGNFAGLELNAVPNLELK